MCGVKGFDVAWGLRVLCFIFKETGIWCFGG